MHTRDDSDAAELADEGDDTVELYLSPEEIRSLLRAAEQGSADSTCSDSGPAVAHEAPLPGKRSTPAANIGRMTKWRSLRIAGSLLIMMAVVSLAGAEYHKTSPHHPRAVAVLMASLSAPSSLSAPGNPSPAPAGEPPELRPLRVQNPFDASETFEFPPGTDEVEARQSVVTLLLERARGRLDLSGGAKRSRGLRNAASRCRRHHSRCP
jgi:hypothetical protein